MKVITYVYGVGKCDIIPVLLTRKLRLREAMSSRMTQLVSLRAGMKEQVFWLPYQWKCLAFKKLPLNIRTLIFMPLLFQLPNGPCSIVTWYISNCEYALEEKVVKLAFIVSLSEFHSSEFVYWIAGNTFQRKSSEF